MLQSPRTPLQPRLKDTRDLLQLLGLSEVAKPLRRTAKSIPEINPLGISTPSFVKTKNDRLAWFIQNKAVIPAEKMPNESDARGYDYLLKKDWESSSFPYTIMEGRYKGDRRLYIFGRESEDSSVILMLRKKDGQQASLEAFTTATAVVSNVIGEVQNNGGQRNQARLSGYDYLKMRSFQMNWMDEPEKNISLKCVQKKIEARVKPEAPEIRDASRLYTHYAASPKQEIRAEESVIYKEETNPTFAEHLKLPETLSLTSPPLACIFAEEGLGLTNGDNSMQVSALNLMSLPANWQAGHVMTTEDVEILQMMVTPPQPVVQNPFTFPGEIADLTTEEFLQRFSPDGDSQEFDWPIMTFDFVQTV